MTKDKFKSSLFSPFIRYMLYSVYVTLIDTAVVWVLYRILNINLVTANTTGVITGFVIHYLLSSKSVFQTKYGMGGFGIYFGTFLMGLVLADWLIYLGETYLFLDINKDLSFLLSKGISIVIPFFVLYFIRKSLFNIMNNKVVNSNELHG